MKGGLIGFGYIGSQGHLPAWQHTPGCEIVAIADICAARRDAAKKACPTARIYETTEDLLAAEQDLDFLDIATPPRDHVPLALTALERGLHVVVEKPIACTPDEARELLDAAKRHKRVVMPCHNYKYAPVMRVIRGLTDQGKLGTIRTATISTFRTTHARGVTEWDTHWRRKHDIGGGGIAMDHGAHSFYVTFMLMGAYPSGITARAFNADTSWDTEDTVTATLAFPQGLVNVYLTWTAGVRKVIYTIHGEHGAAVIDDDDLTLTTREGTEKISIASAFNDASHTSWFASLFADFRDLVADGDFSNRELQEAALCVHLIDRVYNSSASASRELAVEASYLPVAAPPQHKLARAPRASSTLSV